jgi:hypothetical protein
MRSKGGVVNAIAPGQRQLPHGVENPPGTAPKKMVVVEAISWRQTSHKTLRRGLICTVTSDSWIKDL